MRSNAILDSIKLASYSSEWSLWVTGAPLGWSGSLKSRPELRSRTKAYNAGLSSWSEAPRRRWVAWNRCSSWLILFQRYRYVVGMIITRHSRDYGKGRSHLAANAIYKHHTNSSKDTRRSPVCAPFDDLGAGNDPDLVGWYHWKLSHYFYRNAFPINYFNITQKSLRNRFRDMNMMICHTW